MERLNERDEPAASIRPCANDLLFLPVPLKGGGAFVVFGLQG